MLLFALLGFGLRARGTRSTTRGRSGLLLLGEIAAAASLLGHAAALGRSMLAWSAVVVAAMAVVLIVRVKRRRRGDVIMLHAANDEGASVRIRVLSHVLEPNEKRFLQFR